jgi:hypothetical protein
MPPDICESSASGSGGNSQPISAGGRTEGVRRELSGIKLSRNLRPELLMRMEYEKNTGRDGNVDSGNAAEG